MHALDVLCSAFLCVVAGTLNILPRYIGLLLRLLLLTLLLLLPLLPLLLLHFYCTTTAASSMQDPSHVVVSHHGEKTGKGQQGGMRGGIAAECLGRSHIYM